MLCVLNDICSRYGLEYWITAGTLIGAIRHKGFIPWDMDIDLGMTADHAKRLENLRHNLPKDIFFQTPRTDLYFRAKQAVKLRGKGQNNFR